MFNNAGGNMNSIGDSHLIQLFQYPLLLDNAKYKKSQRELENKGLNIVFKGYLCKMSNSMSKQKELYFPYKHVLMKTE